MIIPLLLAFVLQDLPDPVERVMAELRSPSAARREIARMAIRAFGSAALDAVEKGGVTDEAVLDALRGITPEGRALLRRLDSQKVDVDFTDTPLHEALLSLCERSAVKIRVDEAFLAGKEPITLKETGTSLGKLFKRLLKESTHSCYLIASGPSELVLTSSPLHLPSDRFPVRLIAPCPRLPGLLESLGHSSAEVREDVTEEFQRLEFTAEDALWKALESPKEDLRRGAEALLKRLYTLNAHSGPSEISAPNREAIRNLTSKKVALAFEMEPLSTILGEIARQADLSLVIDTHAIPDAGTRKVTFRIAEVSANIAIRLLLMPHRYEHRVSGGVVFISRAECLAAWESVEVVWRAPEDATALERALAALCSADASRHAAAQQTLLEMRGNALEPLGHATQVHAGEASARCRSLRRRIIREIGAWNDEQSCALYEQKLTPAQEALLQKEISAEAVNLPLEKTLQAMGIKTASFRAGAETPQIVWSRGASLKSLLSLMTWPHGLDFVLSGGAVVIDAVDRLVPTPGK